LAVLLVGGTLTGGARWYGASMSHAAAVSVLLVFVFSVVSLRSFLRSRDVFGWLSVGFLIVVAAGSLASPVPRQSALGLLELLAGSALFALCRRHAATPDGRLAVAQLLGAGGVAVAIIACVELVSGAATAPATAPFGQRNFLGAYVALVGPVLVGLAAVAREGWKRWGWGIAAIGLYVSLGFSRSMLGMIGAAGGVGVLGLYIVFERMGNRLRRLAVPIAVVATLALIATPIALGLAVSLETLGTPASRVALERPAVPFVADFSRLVDNLTGRLDPGARGRPVYWRGALTALEERPLLGYGLRSTPFVYAGIRLQPSFRVGSVELDQLHSTPVHLAFETGWLGLSIVTAGFAVALWRGFATPGDPIGRAAVCGVASYAIAVSTNYDLNLEAMGATVALALGLLLPVKPTDAMVQSPHGGFHRNDRGVRLGLAAATFVTAAAFLVPVDVAHYLHDQAVRTYGQEAIAGRLPAEDRRPAYREALELERRAAQWDRHAGWYDLQAAAILERTADDEARAGRDSRPAVLQALGHLRRARDAAPPKIALVRQEAALLHRLEDWPRAIPALQHAVAIHFYHPQPHFLLGEAYFREGEALAARREFGIALALAPALASATRWTASPNNRVEQGHAVAAARGLVLARPWPGAADLHARLLGVLGKASDLPPVGDSVAKRGILHWPVDVRWEDRGTFSYRRPAIPASPGAVAVYSELAKAMHQQGIASSGAYPMVRAEELLRDGAPEPFDASPLPVKRPS
jgi:tetratricopeptide (TPR) repeat protein